MLSTTTIMRPTIPMVDVPDTLRLNPVRAVTSQNTVADLAPDMTPLLLASAENIAVTAIGTVNIVVILPLLQLIQQTPDEVVAIHLVTAIADAMIFSPETPTTVIALRDEFQHTSMKPLGAADEVPLKDHTKDARIQVITTVNLDLIAALQMLTVAVIANLGLLLLYRQVAQQSGMLNPKRGSVRSISDRAPTIEVTAATQIRPPEADDTQQPLLVLVVPPPPPPVDQALARGATRYQPIPRL